jgi:hypothetical protein
VLVKVDLANLHTGNVSSLTMLAGSVLTTCRYRAKTNQASPPAACQIPAIVNVGTSYIVLDVKVPFEGGAVVRFFHIECMDLDDSGTVKLRLSRNALDQDPTIQYRLEHLRAGGRYLVRCCAESSVGAGAFSPWSKAIELPVMTSHPIITR